MHKCQRGSYPFFWKATILTNEKKGCIIEMSMGDSAVSHDLLRCGRRFPTEKGVTVRNYKRVKYTSSLADEMTAFFEGYEERGAPSFEKFARLKKIPLASLVEFRKNQKFDMAYRECSEIRRDYLIDRALDKRFDPTFVRHLLTDEAEAEPGFTQTTLMLEVID